ncbi:hypothetical protein D3C81_1788550 [compost metagenome]
MRVGKLSDSNAAVTTPLHNAPTASRITPSSAPDIEPELASQYAGNTHSITHRQVKPMVLRRPTRSENAPASGQPTAANSRATVVTSSDCARVRLPTSCR